MPPSSEMPAADDEAEQAFLDEALTRLAPERRPEFIGYLRKNEMPVPEAAEFLEAFLNGQTESFLSRRARGDKGKRPIRRAA